MTLQTMSPEETQAWVDRYKGRCADCQGPCERTAQRCWNCERARRKQATNNRTKADGRMNKNMPPMQLARIEPGLPAPEPVGHAHRFVLPTFGDGTGVLVGVCACGEIKEHRPWAEERKWGGG